MDILEKYNLPSDFENDFLKASYSLESVGINELGWNYKDVFKVIDFLIKRKYAILGGDIYYKSNNSYQPTYDNWYINKDNQNWDEFIINSKKRAFEYLNSYIERNEDKKETLIITLVYECK